MNHHRIRAALAGAFMAMASGASAGPAGAAPVTVSEVVQCEDYGVECGVDSFEIRCTQDAQHLAITVASDVYGYLVAVPIFPSSMAGKAKRTRGFYDDPGTLVLHAPGGNPAKIKALVTVRGEHPNPAAKPYQITASCYSVQESPGKAAGGGQNLDDDDPDDPGPDPGPHTVLKGTAITKKQDQ